MKLLGFFSFLSFPSFFSFFFFFRFFFLLETDSAKEWNNSLGWQKKKKKRVGEQTRGPFSCGSVLTHYEKCPVNLNIRGGRKHFTLGNH